MTSFAMAEDVRRDDLDAVDYATQIYADRAIPTLEVRVMNVSAARDACVIAQNVDLGEDSDCLLGRCTNLGAVADVYANQVQVLTCAQCCLNLLQMLAVAVRNDHLHAFVQEALDHPEPDSAGASGDESGSSRKHFHSVAERSREVVAASGREGVSAAMSSSITRRIWVGPRSALVSSSRRVGSESMIFCCFSMIARSSAKAMSATFIISSARSAVPSPTRGPQEKK